MLKKRTRTVKRSTPPAAEQVYTGPLPKSATGWRDSLILVPVEDAPEAPCFVPVNPLGVPPETYYVFDSSLQRVVYMMSRDAQGVSIAWDTDREGRYFLRAKRALICPRFVEYSYDTTNALLAGESWTYSHPNYKGSLGGKLPEKGYKDYSSPRTRAAARKPDVIRKIEETAAAKRASKRIKPLPVRKTVSKAAESNAERLMSDKGALDQAAQKAADDLTKAYGKTVRKPLKKIGHRK